jgi:hypothetical protein
VTPAKASLGANRRRIPSETAKVSLRTFVQGAEKKIYIPENLVTSGTTHPNDTTDTTATTKTAEASHCADATVVAHDLEMDAEDLAHDSDMDTEDPADAADITDADIYEQLTQNVNSSLAYPISEQEHTIEIPSSGQPQSAESHTPPPTPPIHLNGDNSLPELIVDSFPHGSAGVPVPGTHQGSSRYQTSEEVLGTSIWAPFRSLCDWEIARWAKLRGPTSSAVMDLLAIPEVCG